MVALVDVCSIPFGYPFSSELSSGRYPENYIKTFLTIAILGIIYIVRKLGKISDRHVAFISRVIGEYVVAVT